MTSCLLRMQEQLSISDELHKNEIAEQKARGTALEEIHSSALENYSRIHDQRVETLQREHANSLSSLKRESDALLQSESIAAAAKISSAENRAEALLQTQKTQHH